MSVDPPPPAPGLWSPQHRQLTIGLVLTITLVAFEALAVATVMPQVKDDLGGLGLYGWVFSGFFLASLLGIVVAGQLADRRGVVLPYAAGLGLFSLGLVLGGLAGSMPMLVAGRALQGFGAGAIPATAYAAIGRGIPAPLRPKMFAVMSTAWVVPGLVGPGAALAIEHALSWRAVFLVLVPVVVVAGALTVPALRSLERRHPRVGGADADDAEAVAAQGAADRRRLVDVGMLVVGVGAVFAAGNGLSTVLALALVVLGAPLAVRSLVRLLPPGTLRLRPGVPATVAVRGVLTFAFFSADAYVPLAVVDGRGGDTWIAGAALTLCTLLWSAASWTQARLIGRVGPRRLDQVGFGLLATAIVGLILVVQGAPVLATIPFWGLGGFAIGLSYAPLSVTVLAAAPPGEEGAAGAAIQLSDGLGIALGTGVGGWIVATSDAAGRTVGQGVTAVFAASLVVAVGGVLAAGRLPVRVPQHAT